MKKLILPALLTLCFLMAGAISSAQSIDPVDPVKPITKIETRYASISQTGYYYCHCKHKGMKCACIVAPPPKDD